MVQPSTDMNYAINQPFLLDDFFKLFKYIKVSSVHNVLNGFIE